MFVLCYCSTDGSGSFSAFLPKKAVLRKGESLQTKNPGRAVCVCVGVCGGALHCGGETVAHVSKVQVYSNKSLGSILNLAKCFSGGIASNHHEGEPGATVFNCRFYSLWQYLLTLKLSTSPFGTITPTGKEINKTSESFRDCKDNNLILFRNRKKLHKEGMVNLCWYKSKKKDFCHADWRSNWQPVSEVVCTK